MVLETSDGVFRVINRQEKEVAPERDLSMFFRFMLSFQNHTYIATPTQGLTFPLQEAAGAVSHLVRSFPWP